MREEGIGVFIDCHSCVIYARMLITSPPSLLTPTPSLLTTTTTPSLLTTPPPSPLLTPPPPQAAVASSKAKKAARQQSYHHPNLEPPLPDPTTHGARKIDRAIEKNRGLTPHRRRDLKNPRKKNRVKFEKATVRRKGQVQAMREAPGGGYGGESTGINARVSKSVRF